MNLLKSLPILSLGALSFLAGCSEETPNGPFTQATTPTTPTFTAYSCEAVTDPSVAAQLETAKSNITDILKELDRGNLKNAQAVSASTKSTFKAVLDKFPGNCEAQLGYALSIITDLMNNTKIKSFIDTVTNKVDLADMGVEDFNKLLVAGDGKHLTSMGQEAMATAISSVDSAIIYLKNIVGDDKFVCNYTLDDRTFELDRGEFAPTLAAMYVAKAALTFGASINIDISDNGKYDWMNDVDQNDGHTPTVAKQIASFMDKGSSFSTVYDSWKQRYTNIPNLLDSAIQYVEVGLQYGIEESKTGLLTQANDLYVVGDDEMSDVSAKDFQKAIDSLEHYRKALHTGVTVTLPAGSKVTVNIAKFFQITDGWQDYLPYHKLYDYSEWYTPVDGFYWTTQLYGDSHAEYEINEAVRKQIAKSANLDYFYGYLYSNRSYVAGTAEYCADVEIYGSGYSYKCFYVTANGCTLTFEDDDDYYGDRTVVTTPAPITLSPSICQVQNGVPLFATAYDDFVENVFYFTDAMGNKTISIQGLVNGKVDEFRLADALQNNRRVDPVDYTLDDMKKLIFFPDITFGGVLPGMTTDQFWEILKTESRNDDAYDW